MRHSSLTDDRRTADQFGVSLQFSVPRHKSCPARQGECGVGVSTAKRATVHRSAPINSTSTYPDVFVNTSSAKDVGERSQAKASGPHRTVAGSPESYIPLLLERWSPDVTMLLKPPCWATKRASIHSFSAVKCSETQGSPNCASRIVHQEKYHQQTAAQHESNWATMYQQTAVPHKSNWATMSGEPHSDLGKSHTEEGVHVRSSSDVMACSPDKLGRCCTRLQLVLFQSQWTCHPADSQCCRMDFVLRCTAKVFDHEIKVVHFCRKQF